ncbi:histone H3.v1-like [Pyrus ussuriensis x Pyrus communis]|uniref:Histone H3.v1-like n=1 Tax=Pyrus ussuriensis x Pyrus communis TaxID=2448454 RepID=A0A5N5FDS0_9ROSA|nr:zinc finger protein CONSTANS-LIKE 9-like [Pyrus x bretschneideri]KAB2601107.1 histone H3.v1-like [Pyrus ussuriensis x Pyrus communis]
MKKCELCDSAAKMYCESDQASLCWDCDVKVHGANFLVAKHSRTLLCHVCQSPTPWIGSGLKLCPTVSVCENCVNNNEGNHHQDEEEEEEEEEDYEEEDEDEDEEQDDGDKDDDDDNQVVPWSCKPPPPVSSSSSSSREEECSSGSMSISRSTTRREPR